MALITAESQPREVKTTTVVAIVKAIAAVHLNVPPAFGPFSLFLPL